MKKLSLLLLMSCTAFAQPGEWKEKHRKAYLLIKKKTFLFRGCGRYLVTHRENNLVTLFTGREAEYEDCLSRGEHKCTLQMPSSTEMTLDCGVWTRTYTKEE